VVLPQSTIFVVVVLETSPLGLYTVLVVCVVVHLRAQSISKGHRKQGR
jgi:hypothetical protein